MAGGGILSYDVVYVTCEVTTASGSLISGSASVLSQSNAGITRQAV